MRGIPGSVTRGLPRGARMEVIDNTGAKEVEIVMVPKIGGVLKRYPAAGVGDLVVVSVKKGTPEMRRQVLYAVIVRQKRPFKRTDGVTVQFEDNACVIIDDAGLPKGTEIKGCVAREIAERFPKVVGIAASVV